MGGCVTSDNIQGLETLEAWKRAKDFAIKVCKEVLPLSNAPKSWQMNLDLVMRLGKTHLSTPWITRKALSLWKINKPVLPFTIYHSPLTMIH